LSATKPFVISKNLVMMAYKRVKANKGAAGVDQQSLEDFDENLEDNLYRIWNRMSSGSYFPPAVLAVPIEKKSGGKRILAVPTVSDRVAQMVVKLTFEPCVEPHFLSDSYAYRPNKSALDAVGITRQRCWKQDWVIEFDIKGMFDNIDHDLLMKAVRKHTDNKWVILYIERWLKAPLEMPDGTRVARDKGIPQGGVISPVLCNLFLHYVFDVWLSRNFPHSLWCRFADDGVVHCKTEAEAQHILGLLGQRFKDCKLELHPDKTRIIYCKDSNRQKQYSHTCFTFLGYDFRRRSAKQKNGKLFMSFSPAASKSALKSMRAKIRASKIHQQSSKTLEDIAREWNPILRGWINYYGHYTPSALRRLRDYFDERLYAWSKRKYKKLKGRKIRASQFIQKIKEQNITLFVHWKQQENAVVA